MNVIQRLKKIKITKEMMKTVVGIVFLGGIILCLIGLWWNRMSFKDYFFDILLYVGYGLVTLDYIFLLNGGFAAVPWYEITRVAPSLRLGVRNMGSAIKGIFKKKEPEWTPPEEWESGVEVVEEEVIPLAVEPIPFFGNDLRKNIKFGIPLPLSVKRAMAFILMIFSALTSFASLLSPSTRLTVVFTIPFVLMFFDYLSSTQYSSALVPLHILDDLERI